MSAELIDPADPEYELKVAEAFQRTVNAPFEGDDAPVQMTVRQAMKTAAIMSAVARGHSGFTEALRDVSFFFDALVAEQRAHWEPTRTAAEAWATVDAWPWPRPGKPQDTTL